MHALRSYLATFSSSFKMALILWPVASLILTLPILAYLYHRDGRLRFGTFVATYLTVLYVMGLGCFTLYPLPSGDYGPGISYGIAPNYNPMNFLVDIRKEGLRAVLQLAFNVALFMPLGFMAGRLFRMRFLPTLLLGFLASAFIETAQLTGLFGYYDYAYRCCDVDDLITNTLGAALGWLVALLLGAKVAPGKMQEAPITDRPGFVRRAVALWLDVTLIQLVAYVPWLVLSLAWELGFGEPFEVPGISQADTVDWLMGISGLVMFLIVEVLVPWLHDGSTPGGSFVRMTCETHPRTTGYRLVFYAARTLTLAALLYAPVFVAPVLTLFYLIARRMPYDYIP